MRIQQGVVNGRIGRVKTKASNDDVPLDPAFAAVLKARKGDRSSGLVFPSHVTGGCYYAGIIQRQILRPKGERIGFTGLGWHTFRHTYRTLLGDPRSWALVCPDQSHSFQDTGQIRPAYITTMCQMNA